MPALFGAELAIPGTIPTATLNACGEEYSEATLEDGEIVFETHAADPDTADPLVLSIYYGKSGPTTVVFDVTFTPAP